MSTVQIKGVYKSVNNFLKKGGILLDNASDNKTVNDTIRMYKKGNITMYKIVHK